MAFIAGKPDQRGFLQVLALGVFKITFGLYIKLKFNVKMEKNDAYRQEGPYVLLGNHTHNMDPIFIQYFWPRIISYVTNDTAWKSKLLAKILDAVGFIPIKKMTTDSQSVRGIIKNVKKGRIIGIFPEGMRSWDGCTQQLIPSTANLIKKLKLPMVTVKIQGAMMSRPRWSYKARRGRITLSPKVALTAQQVAAMSAEEIFAVLKRELDHNETEYLRAHPEIRFRTKTRAECLELFSYVCPDCRALAVMESESDRFFCPVCGITYIMDSDASIYNENTGERFTLHELNHMQETYTKDIIQTAIKAGKKDVVLFSDREVALFEYIRFEPLKKITDGTLTMHPDRMVFVDHTGSEWVYPADQITGLNIQSNNQLEFSFKDKSYRFLFKERVSPYKWQRSLICART